MKPLSCFLDTGKILSSTDLNRKRIKVCCYGNHIINIVSHFLNLNHCIDYMRKYYSRYIMNSNFYCINRTFGTIYEKRHNRIDCFMEYCNLYFTANRFDYKIIYNNLDRIYMSHIQEL